MVWLLFLIKGSKLIGFLFSLLASASSWAEPDSNKFSMQGEKLFYEGLYGNAIPFYSQALSLSNDEEIKIELSRRLATCYLKEGKAQHALDALSSLASNNHDFYLMSLAYRQLGENGDALKMLNYCSSSQAPDQQNSMISLEKGVHMFHLGDWSSARHVFSSITLQPNEPIPYYIAQLYLAKINLMRGEHSSALNTLNLLLQHLPKDDPLNLERLYLKGWALLAMHQDAQAALCFEEVNDPSPDVLHGLIISLLNQTLSPGIPEEELHLLLSRVQSLLNQLITIAPTETSVLLMADYYLIKGKTLNDPQAYVQAKEHLEKADHFSSDERRRQAELKKAEAASTCLERSRLYEKLSINPLYPSSFRVKASFLKSLNEALAYAHQPGEENSKKGWKTLQNLISHPSLHSQLQPPQEIYYLIGWIALHFKDPELLEQTKLYLELGERGPSPAWSEKCLKLEGLVCMQLGQWLEADRRFAGFLDRYPSSSHQGEIWFWRALSADRLNHPALKKEYLQNSYSLDPKSPFAPIAYFYTYSYQDYMQGSRKAIKHLQGMPLLFPSHPLIITAHYLIGLNQKKDHRSEDGNVIRSKDLTSSIENFHLAESAFDRLFKKNLIPPKELAYYAHIRTRSQLERALANLAIAKSSTGGKREIYLEYAESVFKDLIQDFMSPNSLLNKTLVTSTSPYPKIWAEAELKLAQIYEDKNLLDKANALLNNSLDKYNKAQIEQSYGLMSVWFEKGKIAQKMNDHGDALHFFTEAEKASGDYTGLSPYEKLDLWIQQSKCHQSLNQLEPAMLLLSQVINDDVISPLRIKAMVLRAEIYEMQGRPELAIKQLEAAARKGGEWAQQAQNKLEKTYGY